MRAFPPRGPSARKRWPLDQVIDQWPRRRIDRKAIDANLHAAEKRYFGSMANVDFVGNVHADRPECAPGSQEILNRAKIDR